MKELDDGHEYDTGAKAKALGNTPEDDGDGEKYKGRGPIQITGHDNYLKCSQALYGDDRLLEHPELLERPFDGCMAAGWFWQSHGLNELADAGSITKRINGGTNGLLNRQQYYERALQVLGCQP
jgi:putative chitinase